MKMNQKRKKMKTPQINDRILVLAPHPDDEILGAGGYIYTALKNKAKVKIVIVTHGENFGYAIGKSLKNFLPISQKCQKFAQFRQQESLNLLIKLGLKKKNIIFLGFPDKSLRYLRKKNWSYDKPYLSPLFKTINSPFENIYKTKTVFAGQEIILLIEEILVNFKPNIVITSSVYDDHPDHRALAFFTEKVIKKQKNKIGKIDLYSYLIHKHRLMYPLPYGLHPNKELNPPLSLRGKNIFWQIFPLEEKAILAKEKAILAYETQVIVMGKRLLSFLRQNELFHQVEII